MIELRVLGALDVRHADATAVDAVLAHNKQAALLVYLALAPRGFTRRDTLLGLFWPEADDTRSRASLKQAVYSLRQALGGEVLVTRGDDEVGLDAAQVSCDVWTFDAAVRADDPERAAEAYGGPLLDGFSLRGSVEFDQWADRERERLARAYTGVLERLADQAATRADREAAAIWGRKLAAHSPHSTRVALRVMELLAAVGDRAGALVLAERHAARMRDDLDAAPSPDVLALAARLREHPVGRLVDGGNGGVAEQRRTPTPEPLIAALASRYSIERELGAGGMATVYLAEDLTVNRKVAIKVLRPELAAAMGSERFLREIEISGKLNHPNVLPIFDSGEADGFLYYVMPFLEGESLRDRLNRETQLPVDDAVQITKEVAAALGHSHAQGIMHRDIKPENILISGGHAVVADFGIARAVTMAGGEKLTQTGMAVGTPAYMSPEQATGKNVDHRTDIYALACVTYEMLAGEPPYTGPTVQAIIAKRFWDPVPSIRRIRTAVSEDIDAAIEKALDKTPADRFESTEQFIQALTGERPVRSSTRSSRDVRAKRWVVAAVAGVVMVGGTIGLANLVSGDAQPDPIPIVGAAPEDAIPSASIAVLPFVNRSSDPEQDYFSDGLAEEILNVLAQIKELHVTSRSSAFSFKGQAIEIPEVAARLGVAHVLEGSVQKIGNQVRITAQLIEGATDRHLWSERFDRELSDVFGVQDEIAAAIVEALKSTMGLETEPSVRESQVVSAEAYHLYLKGLQAFGLATNANMRLARSYFEQAIALEPTYAVAHARLSRVLYGQLVRREAPSDLVREVADEAIRLDPTLGWPYTVLARLAEREGDRELRVELTAKAYELAPGDPWVTLQYGRALEASGRMSEAVPLVRKAAELQPLEANPRAFLGFFLTRLGRPAEGLREIDEAIEIDPGLTVGWNQKARASRLVGDLVSSIEAFRRVHELDPENTFVTLSVADNYLSLGDLEAARTWMDEAIRRGRFQSHRSQSIGFEARYLLLSRQGEEALELALREFDTQGAPYIDPTLMEIVVADMIARSALGEAERFLLRYDDRLADFVAGPVQSFVGFPNPGVNIRYAIALQDVYKRADRTAEADALTDRLDFNSMQGSLSTIQLGWTGSNYRTEALWHTRSGRHSEALSALERAVELGFRNNWQFRIRDYFVFEDLRETPRFTALIETIEADMMRQREILAERTAAWVEELAAEGSGTAPRN